MAIAIWASVTGSMAEARIGMLTAMSRVMRLRTSASDGNTSDRPGCSNTSSNVSASRGLPFTAIANSHTPQRLDPLIPSYRDREDRSTATERRSRARIEARFWVGDGGYHGGRHDAKGAAPFSALFLRLSVQPALSTPRRIIFSILAGDHRRRLVADGLGETTHGSGHAARAHRARLRVPGRAIGRGADRKAHRAGDWQRGLPAGRAANDRQRRRPDRPDPAGRGLRRDRGTGSRRRHLAPHAARFRPEGGGVRARYGRHGVSGGLRRADERRKLFPADRRQYRARHGTAGRRG